MSAILVSIFVMRSIEDGRSLIWESCDQILDGKEGETVDKLGGCGIFDRKQQQTID